MARGWFAWETEGYPFWSNLRHARTWRDCRHLPNVTFVHFNDLLSDLAGEISALAEFLDIPLLGGTLREVAEAATFDRMNRNADRLLPASDTMIRGGARTFFYQGTNGRWRDVLTEADLTLYDDAVERELAEPCARWLEGGRRAGTVRWNA